MPVITDGLVGYWHSQQGKSGTTWSNIAPSGTAGGLTVNGGGNNIDPSGSALFYMDGVDDYLTVPTPLNSNTFTIELWIRSDYGQTSKPILLDTDNGIDLHMNGQLPEYSTHMATTRITDNISCLVFQCGVAGNDRNYIFWVNGTSESSAWTLSRTSFLFDNKTAILYLGNNATLTGIDFKGVIDCIKIYNRVLTQAEITQNYQNGTAIGLGTAPVLISVTGSSASIATVSADPTKPPVAVGATINSQSNTSAVVTMQSFGMSDGVSSQGFGVTSPTKIHTTINPTISNASTTSALSIEKIIATATSNGAVSARSISFTTASSTGTSNISAKLVTNIESTVSNVSAVSSFIRSLIIGSSNGITNATVFEAHAGEYYFISPFMSAFVSSVPTLITVSGTSSGTSTISVSATEIVSTGTLLVGASAVSAITTQRLAATTSTIASASARTATLVKASTSSASTVKSIVTSFTTGSAIGSTGITAIVKQQALATTNGIATINSIATTRIIGTSNGASSVTVEIGDQATGIVSSTSTVQVVPVATLINGKSDSISSISSTPIRKRMATITVSDTSSVFASVRQLIKGRSDGSASSAIASPIYIINGGTNSNSNISASVILVNGLSASISGSTSTIITPIYINEVTANIQSVANIFEQSKRVQLTSAVSDATSIATGNARKIFSVNGISSTSSSVSGTATVLSSSVRSDGRASVDAGPIYTSRNNTSITTGISTIIGKVTVITHGVAQGTSGVTNATPARIVKFSSSISNGASTANGKQTYRINVSQSISGNDDVDGNASFIVHPVANINGTSLVEGVASLYAHGNFVYINSIATVTAVVQAGKPVIVTINLTGLVDREASISGTIDPSTQLSGVINSSSLTGEMETSVHLAGTIKESIIISGVLEK